MALNGAAGAAALKLRIDLDGTDYLLELSDSAYVFNDESGTASIEPVQPGVFSVLLGTKSFRVNVAALAEKYEAVNGDAKPLMLSIADPRDRKGAADSSSMKGPAVVRAQMPGKIIKLLVDVGTAVEVGQGLIVVEAMKMQNEVKAPKAGVVTKILTKADATVAAGETLIVVE